MSLSLNPCDVQESLDLKPTVNRVPSREALLKDVLLCAHCSLTASSGHEDLLRALRLR